MQIPDFGSASQSEADTCSGAENASDPPSEQNRQKRKRTDGLAENEQVGLEGAPSGNPCPTTSEQVFKEEVSASGTKSVAVRTEDGGIRLFRKPASHENGTASDRASSMMSESKALTSSTLLSSRTVPQMGHSGYLSFGWLRVAHTKSPAPASGVSDGVSVTSAPDL